MTSAEMVALNSSLSQPLSSPFSGIPAVGNAPATLPEFSIFPPQVWTAPPQQPVAMADPHLQQSVLRAPATTAIDRDKIANAFHNSSRKTLTYIPPSVQNGEVLVRPTIDMIREGSNRWNTTVSDISLVRGHISIILMILCIQFGRPFGKLRQRRMASSFFQFKTMAAMEEVLEGGPWLYLGQPIVLQKWEPGMVLRKLKHTEVPVWIKLRHLPVELWTTDELSTVASGIGRPLYPDAITRACTRLDFARVCVMLNVNSKLPKHIVIMMPNEHGGESACKPAVSIYVRRNQIPAPAPRTGDPILTPNPVFYHPVAKDDLPLGSFPMLNTLFWNVRGLNRRDHQAAVRDLVSEFRLHFIALLETRVMPSNVCRLHAGLLPRWRWFVDYSGPGNRIWIAWNDDFIDVDILKFGSQFVHCRVLMHEMHEPILLTVVYGANEVIACREVWQGLTELAVSVDLPWLVGGDFNAVLDMSEENDFHGIICSTDGRSLWKRLDRMFVNNAWLGRWPNLFYTCLTPRTSDHSPLVLKGDSRDVQHPVIRTSMYSVTRKLKALKSVFSQLRRKKGDLAMNVKLAAGFLEIAQKLLQADRHNSLLLQLENCCRRVATRRANKRLFQISDSDGLVQTDPTIISSVFVTYFQDLLGGDRTERTTDLNFLRPWAMHILTEEEAYALIRPVTVDDVKTAMFDIEEDKAPGPDGFSSFL
ncbi:hypothetical protein Sango_3046700 [Sesamum angolense]|uniref:Endonuclease/exonuclease/phosphatase domain-containing protein n=1 Tax=Sesamum angolense TaxID=2727404 RepID=A0AAE1T9A0_9LAMI|nr:hypothetical protein Sango_3046700 [Sesamum angolense]